MRKAPSFCFARRGVRAMTNKVGNAVETPKLDRSEHEASQMFRLNLVLFIAAKVTEQGVEFIVQEPLLTSRSSPRYNIRLISEIDL